MNGRFRETRLAASWSELTAAAERRLYDVRSAAPVRFGRSRHHTGTAISGRLATCHPGERAAHRQGANLRRLIVALKSRDGCDSHPPGNAGAAPVLSVEAIACWSSPSVYVCRVQGRLRGRGNARRRMAISRIGIFQGHSRALPASGPVQLKFRNDPNHAPTGTFRRVRWRRRYRVRSLGNPPCMLRLPLLANARRVRRTSASRA